MFTTPLTPSSLSDRELVELAQAGGRTAERHVWPEILTRVAPTIRRMARFVAGEAVKEEAAGDARYLIAAELAEIDPARFDRESLASWAWRRVCARSVAAKAARDATGLGGGSGMSWLR